MNKRIPLFVPALAISIPLLMVGCGKNFDDLQPAEILQVATERVATQQIFYQQQFMGKTQAIDSVDIRPKVTGHLLHRTFIEGAQVNKGDLLYVIDPGPYKAEALRLAAVKEQKVAQYMLQVKMLEKAQALGEKAALGSFEIEQIEAETQALSAEVKAAEAALINAELQLSHTKVYAPFDGQIGASKVSVGELVSPDGEALAELISNKAIYVSIQVNEQQYLNEWQGKLSNNRPPEISLEFANGVQYRLPGAISFIDNKIDEKTGNINVRIRFNNPNHVLLPGQYVTLHMQSTEPTNAVLIPQEVVQEDQGGRYVLTVDDTHHVKTNYVELGKRYEDKWVVTSGLNEGDQVIVRGQQKALPNTVVTSIEE
ncbi:efflux RND transporter periplasmic adaptor subunit [Vibrio rotiferianus]|uniref:efflux RND transporter periplasmic adaptor subunit n=1 Tax=Vibrio rotiferianus TaxID=190895 RepID=UPI00406AA87B